MATPTAGPGMGRSSDNGPAPRARSGVELSAQFRAPASELEQSLASLWRARLAVDPVGVDDDLFELGGHSLLAAEMLVEVEELTGVTVSATTLFLNPTIADLARAIENAGLGEGGVSTCDSRA